MSCCLWPVCGSLNPLEPTIYFSGSGEPVEGLLQSPASGGVWMQKQTAYFTAARCDAMMHKSCII